MNLPLRLFVLLCGWTPLALVLAFSGDMIAADPSKLLLSVLLSAFMLLGLCCFWVLFGEPLVAGRQTWNPRRGAA